MPMATTLPPGLIALKREWHLEHYINFDRFEEKLTSACLQLSEEDRLDALSKLEQLIQEPVDLDRLQQVWEAVKVYYCVPREGYVALTRKVLAVMKGAPSSPTGDSQTGASSDNAWG